MTTNRVLFLKVQTWKWSRWISETSPNFIHAYFTSIMIICCIIPSQILTKLKYLDNSILKLIFCFQICLIPQRRSTKWKSIFILLQISSIVGFTYSIIAFLSVCVSINVDERKIEYEGGFTKSSTEKSPPKTRDWT